MTGGRTGAGWSAAARWARSGTAAGVVALLIALAVRMPDLMERSRGETAQSPHVKTGRVCHSDLTAGLELSCGTHGFEDLRHVCTTSPDGGCRPTVAVTVRNAGRTTVRVGMISGPGPGVREEGHARILLPGRTAVLRPGAGRLLFDITLANEGAPPALLEVVGVR